MCQLNNFAGMLPQDAVYGLMPQKIKQSFGFQHKPEEWKPSDKQCHYTGPLDMDWVAQLRSEIGVEGEEFQPLLIDSSCSFGITPYKSDFIGDIEYREYGSIGTAGNGAKCLQVIGRGIVKYEGIDMHGKRAVFEDYAHLVPGSNVNVNVILARLLMQSISYGWGIGPYQSLYAGFVNGSGHKMYLRMV